MWSNFLTVLRAILFTFLALGLVYEAKVADDWRTRCRRVEKERDDARRLNSTYADREHQRRISDAYNRGLYDARTTDGLYRQLLEKHSRGDHATVILYGESKPDADGGTAQ